MDDNTSKTVCKAVFGLVDISGSAEFDSESDPEKKSWWMVTEKSISS
ncbi:MAG: hypothetical protein LBD81_00030 [Holosporaceae bacterium]|nr:hypothetical protein [Holosporaceae bacterium]